MLCPAFGGGGESGCELVALALERPVAALAANARTASIRFFRNMRCDGYVGHGYNVVNSRFGLLPEMEIMVSAAMVRCALCSVASVAKMMLKVSRVTDGLGWESAGEFHSPALFLL